MTEINNGNDKSKQDWMWLPLKNGLKSLSINTRMGFSLWCAGEVAREQRRHLLSTASPPATTFNQ